MDLVVVLSLAACGGQTIRPQSPPDLAPAKTSEPIPVPVAAPDPEPPPEPAPEATPPDPAPQVTPKKPVVLKKKCNPMSRAGCRWHEETDERENVRVTKKPAAPQ
jgi:hypothetical protein